MDVNLRAPVLLAQVFAAQALDESCIVNLLDQRVLKPDPRFFSYALSRAGLHWATTTMAQALAPRIRVNAVAPGPTLKSTHQSDADFEAEWSNVPLERVVTPEAVAAAVIWLASADRVTGQTIAVDSGQHLAWRTPDVQD
jgi:NAD(P)-dependent dehydrogenase (short-subunit alcohol dehydrogenase family)